MITFATLFLGLIVGARNIELVVSAEVASVEIRVDGARVETLRGAPWTFVYDFGAELWPRELLAVAYDGEGRELARARQRINMPRQAAEAGLVLERAEGGRVAAARLTWQSLMGEKPRSVEVSFDGQPLAAPDPSRIVVPPHDPERIHFLRAELDFEGNVSTVADVTFGGRYRDEAMSNLTALPVLLEKGRKLPAPEGLAGWFLVDGQPLHAVAVEEGPAELVFVIDQGAQQPLEALSRDAVRSAQLAVRSGFHRAAGSPGDLLRPMTPLRKDHKLRVVWPVAVTRLHSGAQYELFLRSEEYSGADGGVLWLLTRLRRPRLVEAPQRIADAVGVAGLVGAGRDRRRAVVLLVGPEAQDASSHAAAGVRRYLGRLGVPLSVWSTAAEPASAAVAAWGEITDVSTLGRFESAVARLTKEVDRQRIVWLEGTHPSHRVTLSPRARGLSLVGP